MRKVERGHGNKFHSSMKTVPAALQRVSLPPNQTALMTHDPGTGGTLAGDFQTLQAEQCSR